MKEPTSACEISEEYLNNSIIIPLLSQYGLFIHTCVSENQLCLKM